MRTYNFEFIILSHTTINKHWIQNNFNKKNPLTFVNISVNQNLLSARFTFLQLNNVGNYMHGYMTLFSEIDDIHKILDMIIKD